MTPLDLPEHQLTEQLRCLLTDYHRKRIPSVENNPLTVSSVDQFLIGETSSEQTEMFLLDAHLTHIVQNDSLPLRPALNCIRLVPNSIIYLIAHGNSVLLVPLQDSSKAKIPKAEGSFIFLSNVLEISSQLDIAVAETTSHHLYLILLKRKSSVQLLKLTAQSSIFNLVFWVFKRVEKKIYKQVALHLYHLNHSQHYSLLVSVRDNQVSLHTLQFRPQQNYAKLKTHTQAESISKVIPQSARLAQVIFMPAKAASCPQSIQFVIAYEVEGQFIVLLHVSISVSNSTNFKVNVLADGLLSKNFQMTQYHSQLLISRITNHHHVVELLHLSNSTQSLDHDSHLVWKGDKLPLIVQGAFQVILVTRVDILAIPLEIPSIEESEQQPEVLEQKVAAFKNHIREKFNQVIKEKLEAEEIRQTVLIMNQRLEDIESWINQVLKNELQGSERSLLPLSLEMVSIKVIQGLLNQTDSLNLRTLIHLRMSEINELFGCCYVSPILKHSSIFTVQNLQLASGLLLEVSKLPYISTSLQAIRQIFQEHHEVLHQQARLKKLLQTHQYLAYLGTAAKVGLSVTESLLQYLANQETQLIKPIIKAELGHSSLADVFPEVNYSTTELYEIFSDFNESQDFIPLVESLLLVCKRRIRSSSLPNPHIKIDNLLQALVPFADKVIPVMKHAFSTIRPLFNLKKHMIEHGQPQKIENWEPHSDSAYVCQMMRFCGLEDQERPKKSPSKHRVMHLGDKPSAVWWEGAVQYSGEDSQEEKSISGASCKMIKLS